MAKIKDTDESFFGIEPRTRFAPLAERMRPKTIYEVVGQQHLIAKGKPLEQMVASGN